MEELQAKEEARFHGKQKMTRWLWIYLVLLSTVFLMIGGWQHTTNKGLWFGILACFWMGFGSVTLNQMWHDRNRLELRKEIVRLELTMQRLVERLEEKEGEG